MPTTIANDTVKLSQGPLVKINADTATAWSSQLIDGMAGFDTIVVDESSTKTGYFTFAMSHDAVVTFTSASGAGSKSVSFTNFEKIQFWDVNMFLGTIGNDTLTGTAFAENLYGFDGNDIIDGGAGNDKMYGGAGDDSYILSAATDIVGEKLGEGTDTIKAGFTYSLVDTDGAGLDGGNVENLALTGTGNFNGTGNALNNVLSGNTGVNVLSGGAGDDTLDGGGGADLLLGGAGNDTYLINDAAAVITELAGEGTKDLVKSTVSLKLSANVENLTLLGTAALSATGNNSANKIIGNSGANVITGGGGKDTLTGKQGADTFDFNSVSELANGPKHDVITDFAHGSDKIDLTGIDADTTPAGIGNNAFTFVDAATSIFTGAAGELHFYQFATATGTHTMIEGDVNGDLTADLQIELIGAIGLTGTDFNL